MMSRLGALLLLILLVLGCIWLYHQHELALAHNGEVVSHDGSPVVPSDKEANSNQTSSSLASSASSAQGSSNTAQTTDPARAATLPPNADSVAPNPPNGLAFGGTGRFQWYRQGNLTWRVDTGSGEACVAFATMEEWRKPIVSSNGCGSS